MFSVIYSTNILNIFTLPHEFSQRCFQLPTQLIFLTCCSDVLLFIIMTSISDIIWWLRIFRFYKLFCWTCRILDCVTRYSTTAHVISNKTKTYTIQNASRNKVYGIVCGIRENFLENREIYSFPWIFFKITGFLFLGISIHTSDQMFQIRPVAVKVDQML